MTDLLIKPLRSLSAADAATFGAKAANLGRLAQAGLPVPPGFCISGDAFLAHVDGISAVAEPGAMRAAILEKPVAPALADAIAGQLTTLGDGPLAVRSSATTEDTADASFAGQHDTVLGVVGRMACLDAVRRCWASLWSERADEYRRRRGLDGHAAAMGVIVQTLVPAEASGVLFTADPVSGRVDRIVIEGALGLGETVVTGRQVPDRFTVLRSGYRILDRAVASKSERIALDPAGGVRVDAVPADRAEAPCLDTDGIRALAKLAVAAEGVLGGPLDVEWAAADGAVHLLQARPITTTAAPKAWDDRQVWTNANAGEVMPDVMSPMTASVIEPMVHELFGRIGDWLGIDMREVTLFDVIAGRVYFNLNTFLGILKGIPGLRNRSLPDLLGGRHGEMEALGALEIPDEDVPDLRVHWGRRLIGLPGMAVKFLTHSPARGERYMTDMAVETEAQWRTPWTDSTDEALIERTAGMVAGLTKNPDGFIFVGVGVISSLGLYNACRRWFGETGDALASRMLAGLGTMENAEAGLALWRLADVARARPEVRAAVRSGGPFSEIEKTLRGSEAGRAFLELWDAFLWRHGHHTRGEVEIANPRWSERPEYVVAMLERLLDAEGHDPVARAAELARQRAEVADDCRRRLGPIRRRLFDLVLKRAVRGAPIRENLKSTLVRRVALIRALLLELGARLAERGKLESADDVFFLRLEELAPALREDVAARVESRRAEHVQHQAIRPPSVIVGRFDPCDFEPDPVDRDARTLRGVAVSPGRVTGRARVILHAGDDGVRPGEILVAPFTDPGWSPYFLNAAAIVMDLGGILSHGSIIAREYGIPCVVDVGPATEIIRTGQTLTVDGDRGVVEVG